MNKIIIIIIKKKKNNQNKQKPSETIIIFPDLLNNWPLTVILTPATI